MALHNLTLLDWSRMSDETARRECEELVHALPHNLQFAGLDVHTYCGREHRIARFSRKEAYGAAGFVLVPGGEVTLGFNGQDFEPTTQQTESFACSAEEYGIDQPIREFVGSQTSARRTASVLPALVEVDSSEVGVEPVGSDHPVFAELRQQLQGEGRTTMEFVGGPPLNGYVIERDADGACRAWYRRPTSLADLEAALAEAGMRLLTCDEWEHACGAGAPTLFRWGHDSPSDFYPGENSAEHRRLNTAWALSAGKLEFAPPPPVWDMHERPNLFGLRIARNPYRMDLVSDGPRLLGGDGGCNICGGAGFFLGWLPLATAFRDPDLAEWHTRDNVADGFCRVRRVIAVH